MRFVLFFIKRDVTTHKLTYSKTTKGDVFGALFGVIVGAFCGYLALSSLGGSSVDLSDLTTLL